MPSEDISLLLRKIQRIAHEANVTNNELHQVIMVLSRIHLKRTVQEEILRAIDNSGGITLQEK